MMHRAHRASSSAFPGRRLGRDRLVVGAALAIITLCAWLYLVRLEQTMASPSAMVAAPDTATAMTPSAAPVVLGFAAVHRRRVVAGGPAVPTAVFVFGYLVVWTGFSFLATLAQTALHAAAVLSPAMATTSPLLSGGLLIAVGVFQWTPFKHACLARCRAPQPFLMREWRERWSGAVVMGMRHGLYCFGCCWAFMALLFVAGVMNLLWVAAIAATVLIEKALPGGDLVGRVAGGVLAVAGVLVGTEALALS